MLLGERTHHAGWMVVFESAVLPALESITAFGRIYPTDERGLAVHEGEAALDSTLVAAGWRDSSWSR